MWMIIKRMAKHPAYWILLILFPAVLWMVPKLNKEASEGQILVGYVIEGQDKVSGQGSVLLGQLELKLSATEKKGYMEQAEEKGADGGSPFLYVECEDRNELERKVMMGELACGVVFGENFADKLLNQDYHNSIMMYLPEGMNIGGMVQEDLFQRVYQVYSALWYADMLSGQGYRIEAEEVLKMFSEYQKQGKVFSVQYGQWETEMRKGQDTSIVSLRGVLAFLTLLAAAMGALDGCRNREKGTGTGIPFANHFIAAVVGAPILFAVFFQAWGMIAAGEAAEGLPTMPAFLQMVPEIGGVLLYGVILWIFAMFASRFFPEKLLAGFMPCYLLLVIVCCPVFFDLGKTVPLIGYLSKVFPLTWYLELWG